MTQTEFDFQPIELNSSVLPEDADRLTRHCRKMLEMLQCGPVTNAELAAISLNHTARISELRRAGYKVRCTRLKGGLTRYELLCTPTTNN